MKSDSGLVAERELDAAASNVIIRDRNARVSALVQIYPNVIM
jgi:hypothetical protein